MSQQKEAIEIIRITEKVYPAFCKFLEWRRTGQKENDPSRYLEGECWDFIKEFNVLNSDTLYIYAAKLGDEFVGYINGVLMPKPDPRLGIMFVDELWVPEEYRGQGIAGQLLDKLTEISRELKLWRVRLYVGPENSGARKCYKKAGYIEKANSIFCEIDL